MRTCPGACMQTQKVALPMAVWNDGNGHRVDYAEDVIEDLRRLSVDGLNAFRHGGKEIGGLLYGRRDESVSVVLGFTELECEHALGPRFILSENDHAALAGLMTPLAGLEPIGWFRTHTRSGLELDSKDRELFDRYFEAPASVGLVLKPTQWGPASGAFYVRGNAGQIGPEPFREFAIALPGRETPTQTSSAETSPRHESRSEEPEPLRETVADTPKSQTVEETRSAAELVPAPLVASITATVFTPSAAATAALARARARTSIFSPRLGAALALCAGALLGAWITLMLEPRTSQPVVHATTPLQANPSGAKIAGEPLPTALPTALAVPQAVSQTNTYATRAPQPRNGEEPKPAPRRARIPEVVRSTSPSPSLPAPPAEALDLKAAPQSVGVSLESLLPPAPAPAPAPPLVAPKHAPVYAGPRQGRLLWMGNLARRGVIEMEGSRVSPGSIRGALPGVPLALRVMAAEFSRDGLTVFTSDPLRDNKTEAPAQSNGWNGIRFKLDPVRARELVLLETPNSANNYKAFAVRNDGRPCSVVLLEWQVE